MFIVLNNGYQNIVKHVYLNKNKVILYAGFSDTFETDFSDTCG
jgi:hypothetical protein